MSNLVIVALPAQNDYIWQISSEKVPHMTLLFLGEDGEVDNTQTIVEFVEHAAHGLDPFYMEADYRGVLGKDDADVLFFDNGGNSFKNISEFRGQLLKNSAIKTAYNSVEQFPEWTPHLTLGYPATPAKVPDKDRTIYSVEFDRIAVWTGDFDGPEFRLKYEPGRWDAPLSMSAEDAKTLLHFGVKGMRWGRRMTEVRQDTGFAGKASGKKATPKKVAKLDKKFEKDTDNFNAYIKVHNAAGDHFNKHIDELNKKYPGDLLAHENREKLDAYNRDAEDLMRASLREGAKNVKNASGTKTYDVKFLPDGNISITTKAIEHDDASFTFIVNRNDMGKIVDVKPDTLAQGQELISREFSLKHYGTKGMKWGVRKEDRNAPTAVTATPATTKKGKAAVKTSGGTRQPAHPDAIKAATAKQQLNKSGLNSLSNKELQQLATRMELEAKINRLNPQKLSAGQRFIKAMTGKDQRPRDDAAKAVGIGAKIFRAARAHRNSNRGSDTTVPQTTRLLNP